MRAAVGRVVRPLDRLDLVMSYAHCEAAPEPEKTCRCVVNQVLPQGVLALRRRRLSFAGIAVHYDDLSCR